MRVAQGQEEAERLVGRRLADEVDGTEDVSPVAVAIDGVVASGQAAGVEGVVVVLVGWAAPVQPAMQARLGGMAPAREIGRRGAMFFMEKSKSM